MRTFNVSQIIQNQIPDSEGNIIPAVVHEGGIKIAGSQSEIQHILLAVDSGIYNVRKATCGPGCQVGNGLTFAVVFSNPSVVAIQRTNQLSLVGTWGTGGQYNLPGTWTSEQTSIATVGASSGMSTGISPGSALVYSTASNQPIEIPWLCGGGGCPTTAFYAQAPANVFQVTSVSPAPFIVGSSGVTLIGGSGFSNLPSPLTVSVNIGGITITNASISSDTLITASYTVASNAPLGQQLLTVSSGGADGGYGTSSNPFPVTVRAQPEHFSVAYSSYIPVDHVYSASPCDFQGAPVFLLYMGDANRGTYRTTEAISITPDSQAASGFFPGTGQTRNYGLLSPANGSTLSSQDEDGVQYDCYLWNDAATASPSGFTHDESFPYSTQGQSHFAGSASNPLELVNAPIDWDMRTVIDDSNQQSPTAYVNYNHTCYPSHQIKVNNQIVYLYTPPRNDTTYIFGCLVVQSGKITGQTVPVQVPAQ